MSFDVTKESESIDLVSDQINELRQNLAISLQADICSVDKRDTESLKRRLSDFVSERKFSILEAYKTLEIYNLKVHSASLMADIIRNMKISAINPGLFSYLPDSIEQDEPLYLLIKDEEMYSLAKEKGIISLDQFLKLSVDSQRFLLIKEKEPSYEYLAYLQDKKLKRAKDNITSFITQEHIDQVLKKLKIKPKYLEIIKKRGLIFDKERRTLDELGKEYGVTRERIRQIESSTKTRIFRCFNAYSFENHFLKYCFNVPLNDNLGYCDLKTLKEFINNEDYFTILAISASNPKSTLKLSSEYEIIYDSEITSLDELINDAKKKMGKLVNSSLVNLDSFKKTVLKNFYLTKDEKVYRLRGFTSVDVLNLAIERYFPNGYHINQLSENDDFIYLKKMMKEGFGMETFIWTPRNVSALLERNPNCILIDKGLYQLKSRCASLSEDLKKRINDFILSNPPIVYYITIYTQFKDELESLGVDNYFYLKGLIDPTLPAGVYSKRNYIQVGENKTTAVDNTIKYMRSFPGVFSLSDLEEAFPGVKTYTFMQYAYQERNRGLMFLPNNRFLYIERLDISKQTKEDYKEFLLSLFSEFKVSLLTSSKVYSLLTERRPDIIEGLKIADDSYILFSITEQLYKDSFYFRRPYFSLENNANSDHLLEYIYTLEKFNKDDLVNYAKATGLKILNYLQLINKCYEDYVQVDKFTFVRKDVFSITDEDIEKCRLFALENLEYASQFSLLEADRTSNLPSLSIPCNGYLLAGIYRTFLNDQFKIVMTGSEYSSTDYLVRFR